MTTMTAQRWATAPDETKPVGERMIRSYWKIADVEDGGIYVLLESYFRAGGWSYLGGVYETPVLRASLTAARIVKGQFARQPKHVTPLVLAEPVSRFSGKRLEEFHARAMASVQASTGEPEAFAIAATLA